MTPNQRNILIDKVFERITTEGEFFLGFNYNPLKQTGSCNCVNTNFLRIPMFLVSHKISRTVVDIKTHHKSKERISIPNNDNFEIEAYNKIRAKLQKYAQDWD